jgi:hypothetical protein
MLGGEILQALACKILPTREKLNLTTLAYNNDNPER